MFPKLMILAVAITLLSACAAPNPVALVPTATQPSPTETLMPSPIPTETLIPTPTLTPAATETEAPKKEIIDIDVNGDGAPDFEGTVEEEKYIEVTEGEPTAQNMIRIGENWDIKNIDTSTQFGYFTGYKRITIESEGQFASMIFFQVKYFREGKDPITVEFSTLESEMIRMFPTFKNSLGKRILVGVTLPMGDDFTDQNKENVQKALKFTNFQFQMMFPEDAQWLKAKEMVNLLKNSDKDLNFKFKARVGYITQ